jgi:transposase-like protein
MKEYADKLMPDVADFWHADETMLNVNGQYQWMWNDATNLFLERITGVVPNALVTDGLGSYDSAFGETFAKKHTRHIQKPPFIDKANNNMTERLHGTIKERIKTMRGLDDSESASNMVDGVRLGYNFMRPHSALDGKHLLKLLAYQPLEMVTDGR